MSFVTIAAAKKGVPLLKYALGAAVAYYAITKINDGISNLNPLNNVKIPNITIPKLPTVTLPKIAPPSFGKPTPGHTVMRTPGRRGPKVGSTTGPKEFQGPTRPGRMLNRMGNSVLRSGPTKRGKRPSRSKRITTNPITKMFQGPTRKGRRLNRQGRSVQTRLSMAQQISKFAGKNTTRVTTRNGKRVQITGLEFRENPNKQKFKRIPITVNDRSNPAYRTQRNNRVSIARQRANEAFFNTYGFHLGADRGRGQVGPQINNPNYRRNMV